MTLIRKEKMETSTNTVYFDPTSDQEDHYVFKGGLKTGFYIYNDNLEDYVNYSVLKAVYSEDANAEYSILEVEPWDIRSFSNLNVSDSNNFGFYWIKDPDSFILKGNKLSNTFVSITIIFSWAYWSGWPPYDEVMGETSLLEFQLFTMTPYVDFNDIENPIKYSLDMKYYNQWDPNSFSFQVITIQK